LSLKIIVIDTSVRFSADRKIRPALQSVTERNNI
jgi:hypothetical protein